MRPNFAKPIDTVEDLVNSDILIYEQKGGEYWQQQYAASPKESYRKMATLMFFTDDVNNYTRQMAEEGGLAAMGYMGPWDIYWGRKHHPQGAGISSSTRKNFGKETFYIKLNSKNESSSQSLRFK